jgi:hypothetical protein
LINNNQLQGFTYYFLNFISTSLHSGFSYTGFVMAVVQVLEICREIGAAKALSEWNGGDTPPYHT